MTIEEMLKTAKADVERLSAENTSLKADADKHEGDLQAALDLVPEATAAELTQAKADLVTAKATIASLEGTVKTLKTDADSTTKLLESIGIKADAEAKTNHAALTKHAETLAATKAAQIVAAQGADAPLPTGAATSGAGNESTKNKSTLELWTEQAAREASR